MRVDGIVLPALDLVGHEPEVWPEVIMGAIGWSFIRSASASCRIFERAAGSVSS